MANIILWAIRSILVELHEWLKQLVLKHVAPSTHSESDVDLRGGSWAENLPHPELPERSLRSPGSNSDGDRDQETNDTNLLLAIPTLDEKKNSEGQHPKYISIYLNGEWRGAAVKYNKGKESFVKREILERYGMKASGPDIETTWSTKSLSRNLGKSHYTRFIIRKDLPGEVVLGQIEDDLEAEDVDRVGVETSFAQSPIAHLGLPDPISSSSTTTRPTPRPMPTPAPMPQAQPRPHTRPMDHEMMANLLRKMHREDPDTAVDILLRITQR